MPTKSYFFQVGKIEVFILLLGFFIGQLTFGQSIRKGFDEMTDYEITELVDAFYELRNGPDLFNDLATFHGDFFNFDNSADPTRLDLHFNLPDESEREIFLAWHRRQMFEMEQAVQEINPEISLGYWNSIIYQSPTDAIWDESFLGSFDANWSLNRNLASNGPMPTATDLNNLITETDFFTFSNRLERQAVHRGAHVWTGGAMPTPLSPRDPVFYFHHSHVDKVWQDWEEIHQSSSYITTSMLRYDGTYVFDGETLPLVDPNDITDSRVYGVFYAENGLAQLDNYIVSNTYNPEEIFYYQFNIEAGNNFIVPAGTVARFESVNEINLVPGFEAAPGSSFEASIDVLNGGSNKASTPNRAFKPYPFSEKLFEPIVWEEGGDLLDDKPVIITAHPNPFTEKITINLSKRRDCVIEVFNMMGMLIREEAFQNTDTLVIKDLYGLSSGFYVIRVTDAEGNLLVVKRLIKM
ncbi:T9SS type A sorting domain-containing protein [Muricauda sp. JGD-17]|uniref:T9SS type A sorting domain-containing protein n=1 Tax=Flagellimonas ochracea TaxID=2696472 RepID=A0A964TAH5_9FLAO|nr:tyrosinase family protein [Allomuricauda ochracea]NAY91245.1 T9SS type A sorting domain-containing protein [Allomuricauda ochracea]